METVGLNASSFDVLATLRRSNSDEGLSPNGLLNATMVTSGTMTNRIDQLQKSGLVIRVANPKDKRSCFVKLTQSGLELIDAAITDHVRTQKELVSSFTSEQRLRFNIILADLM
ncbi:MarR family winged helix-turn-helix transcriptional regulator [Phaeobacter sp. C3_T13_0]|uniref:MarR family winged helix-turn-helix transcriptional regulator n=1 Tax=Phaeobacter cretensis TaxID=3342641 RepID=UPI0039BD1EF0